MDKQSQLEKLHSDIEKEVITDESVIKSLERMINTTYDEKIVMINDMFAQIDDRRKVSTRFPLSFSKNLHNILETRSTGLFVR